MHRSASPDRIHCGRWDRQDGCSRSAFPTSGWAADAQKRVPTTKNRRVHALHRSASPDRTHCSQWDWQDCCSRAVVVVGCIQCTVLLRRIALIAVDGTGMDCYSRAAFPTSGWAADAQKRVPTTKSLHLRALAPSASSAPLR
jgi:hypothetical protein